MILTHKRTPLLLFLLLAFSLLLIGCAPGLPGSMLLTPPSLRVSVTPTITITSTPTDTATPSATPSPTSTETLTLTFTASPTATNTPTPSDTPTPSETPTYGPSLTYTRTSTITLTLRPTRTDTPTPTASRTRVPTNTPTVTRTPTITYTPTVTNTPTPPPPTLRLDIPGPLSKVISPIQVRALAVPGENGNIILELIGEDGRVISHQDLDFHMYMGRQIAIVPVVEYSINTAAETARLEMSIEDAYQRKIALTSVDLILQQVGRREINPSVIVQDPYLIRRPYPGSTIRGGLVRVEALARPVNSRPVIVELLDEQDQILASASLQVPAPQGPLSHTPFTVDLEYSVTKRTSVRLTIRQDSAGRIPGTVQLSSQEIFLEP